MGSRQAADERVEVGRLIGVEPHVVDQRRDAEQLLAAIATNKHIYCEKPLVPTAAELDEVVEALGSYRGIGQMTLQYRFYPATLRAKQMIDEGFLGQVISFRAVYLHSGSIDLYRVDNIESCPNKMEIDLEKIRQNDIFFGINKK